LHNTGFLRRANRRRDSCLYSRGGPDVRGWADMANRTNQPHIPPLAYFSINRATECAGVSRVHRLARRARSPLEDQQPWATMCCSRANLVCSDFTRASFEIRSSRLYSSFGDVPIFRFSSFTASENAAVAESYSFARRAFSSQLTLQPAAGCVVWW
jgi:hypothetical protein